MVEKDFKKSVLNTSFRVANLFTGLVIKSTMSRRFSGCLLSPPYNIFSNREFYCLGGVVCVGDSDLGLRLVLKWGQGDKPRQDHSSAVWMTALELCIHNGVADLTYST